MLQVGAKGSVEKPESRGLHAAKDRQVFSKSNAIKPKSINSPEQGSRLERKNSGLAITATPIRRGHFHATVLSKIDTQMSYAFSSLGLALSRASFQTAEGYQPSPSPPRIYLRVR
jgi:hypothetical protein